MNKRFVIIVGILFCQIACSESSDSHDKKNSIVPDKSVGKTGSLARFSIIGDYLYAVNGTKIKSFDISVPAETKEVSEQEIEFGIETIFGSNPYLFIGGEEGLYIYDVGSSPATPHFISQFGHARSCDPVVVENDIAFITLRNTGACPGSVNELKVVDVTNIRQPALLKSYPLTSPFGLSAIAGRLYVCDGDELKLFNSEDVQDIQLIKSVEKKACTDIIYNDSSLIVSSSGGITQYQVNNDELEILSHLGF